MAILGPSGCGKTTLLNIIGGLDHYTEGDLIIDGRSTKQYSARDWDTYRNHTIGFVFQNYYLIPHQNVLRNVDNGRRLVDTDGVHVLVGPSGSGYAEGEIEFKWIFCAEKR